ncbi:MAG: insulinase family protein [Planctomycetota bacterium]
MSIGNGVDRAGMRHVVSIHSEFPEDSKLPAGEQVFEQAIAFLAELIQQPHLVEECFCEQTVQNEALQHRRTIEGRIDDKRSWAIQRCIEETCPDEPWRFHEYGMVETLDAATPELITDLWRQMIATAPMHVHFSGDIDPEVSAARLQPLFDGNAPDSGQLRESFPLKGAEQTREVTEYFQVQQANLVLALRTSTGFDDPLHESMLVANGVLGQFPHSRLFTQVREKESLCYSVNSHNDASSGLMLVSAGIDVGSAPRARESILEQIEVVRQGEFSAEEFDMTLSAWDSRLRMIQDSPASLAEFDLTSRLCGREPDLDALRGRIAAVTREGVVEAARRLELDLVYLMAPEEAS